MTPIGDAIGNVVNNAKDAVEDVTSMGADAVDGLMDGKEDLLGGAGETLGDAASQLFDQDVFEMDTLSDLGGAILDNGAGGIGGVDSVGSAVSGAVDSLGMADWAGDVASTAVEFAMGNPEGVTEHGENSVGHLADAADHGGLEGFLDMAGDVTGMFNDGGMMASLSDLIGGVDGGILSQLGDAGQFDQLGDILGQVTDLAGHADSAIDLVDNFRDGDLAAAGADLFDCLGGNFDSIADLLGDAVDPGMLEQFEGVFGEGGELLSEVLGEFGDSELLSELSATEILEELGVAEDEINDLAETIVDLAGDIAEIDVDAVGLGTAMIESEAGQELIGDLTDIAEKLGGEMIDGVDGSIQSLLTEAMMSSQGMIDVADHDEEVAAGITELLEQAGSMTDSASVSDMMGAQVRV